MQAWCGAGAGADSARPLCGSLRCAGLRAGAPPFPGLTNPEIFEAIEEGYLDFDCEPICRVSPDAKGARWPPPAGVPACQPGCVPSSMPSTCA